VGLGLAVARGFTEAMNGTLNAEDTPGGGLTMVLTLRAAKPFDPAPADSAVEEVHDVRHTQDVQPERQVS
jgi:two-component system sensor histidine kinase KdpD